jgi:hypothetical protein
MPPFVVHTAIALLDASVATDGEVKYQPLGGTLGRLNAIGERQAAVASLQSSIPAVMTIAMAMTNTRIGRGVKSAENDTASSVWRFGTTYSA